MRTVQTVRGSSNPRLKIQGIVLTMYDRRNNLSGQVAADVRDNFGTLVYDTVIPRNVRSQRGAVACGAGADLRPHQRRQPRLPAAGAASCWPAMGRTRRGRAGVIGGVGMERKGLGRGLSALLADVATIDEAPAAAAGAAGGDRQRADRPDPRQPEPAAPRLRREGARRPRRLDPREGRDPAADPAPAPGRAPATTRSSPASGAGGRRSAPACTTLPAVVRELDDAEVLELAIIENVQRADLNPLEEAQGYRQLMDRFGHTQERLAEAVGKSRSHIANLLRLLTLPEPVLDHAARRPADRRSRPGPRHRDEPGVAGAPGGRPRPVGPADRGAGPRRRAERHAAAGAAPGRPRTPTPARSRRT